MSVSTPPLSPRRNVNVMSPSPLRIGEGDVESSENKENENENDENKENEHDENKYETSSENVCAGEKSDAVAVDNGASALLGTGAENQGANAGLGSVVKGGSRFVFFSFACMRVCVCLDMVLIWVGSAGCGYVSPSDALMSPCTQQLNALKGKRFARGGEGGVRRLFGDRIGRKGDVGDVDVDVDVDADDDGKEGR